MSFDINEQMKKDEKAFGTLEQRNIIYKEYLIPLKARISQILLYDVEVANTLLQKYLKVEKNADRAITEIMADITDLEVEIQEYEENKGKEELFKKQSIVISSKLDDLKESSEQIEIKDFESRLLDIRELFNKNIENYSYEDRSVVETKISEVQARLIIRKVRLGALDLHKEISKDDEARLTMVINNSIVTLMQEENPDVQNIINEIRYKMIDRTDVVFDPEIWRLLDSAQRGIENDKIRKIEDETLNVDSSNALVPIENKKRKGFSFPSLEEIFGNKVIRIGTQKMRATTKVKYKGRMAKVRELAEFDLRGLLDETSSSGKQLISDYIKNKSEIKEFYFYNEQGKQAYVKKIIALTQNYHYTYVHIIEPDGTKLIGDINVAGIMRRTSPVINYTELLDKILNSNLKDQLLREIGIFMEKVAQNKEQPKDMRELLDELPIYGSLSKSFEKFEEKFIKMGYGLDNKKRTSEMENSENEDFKDSIKVKLEENQNDHKLSSGRKDAFGELLGTYSENQNQTNQSSVEQEISNEENGDGTEYRGG